MATNHVWTPERVEVLQTLAEAKTPHAVIAAALSVSETAIAKKLFDLKQRALGTSYVPRERIAKAAQASDEAVAALYAGQRYDDIILRPSRYEAKLWPHKPPSSSSLTGCGLNMMSYNSGRRVHAAGRSAG